MDQERALEGVRSAEVWGSKSALSAAAAQHDQESFSFFNRTVMQCMPIFFLNLVHIRIDESISLVC